MTDIAEKGSGEAEFQGFHEGKVFTCREFLQVMFPGGLWTILI